MWSSSRDVADHYDELDQVYREIWGDHVHHGYWATGNETKTEAVDALVELVAKRLKARSGEHFCDIGCGYGASAALLANSHDVRVTGLTLSGEQYERASDREGSLVFLRRDWLANSLPDAAFDGAYAIESSEHMVDKQRFFDEACRTVKPGGRLIVCAWLASSTARKWEVRHLLEPICREGRLPSMETREEYETMARRAGFEIHAYRDLSRNVRRTWTICLARLAKKLATEPYYRKLLLNSRTRNRDFALSLPRLIIAYRTGAMRYGLFTFKRLYGEGPKLVNHSEDF